MLRNPPSEGALDGMTLLRFAHAFRTGGGMERILDDLDNILLSRSAMTVIRLYIASNSAECEVQTVTIGRGQLVLVPLYLPKGEGEQLAPDREERNLSLRRLFRDRVLYHPLLWNLGVSALVRRRRLSRRKGEVVGAGSCVADLAGRYKIDLCLMHFFGGSDADEVIEQARAKNIPIALENHFSNDRFLHLSIRKHVMLADGVAGMNGLDLPDYLGKRYCNLADGIDIRAFDRRLAVRPKEAPTKPILFLPSRIVRPKGQLDLVRAAAALRDRGIDVAVALAGRIDSGAFMAELKAEIARLHLTQDVHLLGELGPSGLRDWYATSAVLAFPTYHHEGLGRIIVEAQAMEIPVVAYATGGVPEGVMHEQTGFLVPTGNLEEFVARLEFLLRNEERRKTMGKAGREFVSGRYSLEALAERHESFYLRVMTHARARLSC